MNGTEAGYVEVKLHDDKGDIELWIATRRGHHEAHRPAAQREDHGRASPTRSTPSATWRSRNKDKNEDEDGNATNRNGMTNYFIFPGDTGADASWLMGTSFKDEVTVSFANGAAKYSTKAFELVPHTHGEHGHDHK